MLTDILTDKQAQTLKAAVERIIPADDAPSGWEAGVGEFFARLLVREPDYLPMYQAGLDTLGSEAEAQGASFPAMTAETQDRLLAEIESGHVSTIWPIDPAAFFRLLVEQTLEGFYADPGNGGNKDRVAWNMIGYVVTV